MNSATITSNEHSAEASEKKSYEPTLWHSITKHPWLRPYNRLAVAVLLANIWAMAFLVKQTGSLLAISHRWLSTLIIVNFTAAILIRQQYVINALFKIATSIPLSWPLAIRWAAGKVYHFGGIHVGGFAAGTLWLALATLSAFQQKNVLWPLLLLHVIVLVAVIAVALPKFRQKHHDTFERIGRFGSWLSLLMFWLQLATPLVSGEISLALWMLDWQVWTLSLATTSTALPWLRLRKVKVNYTRPSNHAVLAKFDHGVTPFPGSSTDLSISPLW